MAAFAWSQFDIVYDGTDRKHSQRQAVTDLRSGSITRNDGLTYLKAVRRNDIVLGTVSILNQGDTRRTFLILLDC